MLPYAPAGGSADDGFSKLLQRIASSVEASCSKLLHAVAQPSSGLHALNLLGNAILAEVLHSVAQVGLGA